MIWRSGVCRHLWPRGLRYASAPGASHSSVVTGKTHAFKRISSNYEVQATAPVVPTFRADVGITGDDHMYCLCTVKPPTQANEVKPISTLPCPGASMSPLWSPTVKCVASSPRHLMMEESWSIEESATFSKALTLQ